MLVFISPQAFRAVLMKKKKNGLLALLDCAPQLKYLTCTQLQQLCLTSYETTLSAGSAVVMDGENLLSQSWTMLLVLGGCLSKSSRDSESKGDERCSPKTVKSVTHTGEGACVFFYQCLELTAQVDSKIVVFPETSFLDIVGQWPQYGVRIKRLPFIWNEPAVPVTKNTVKSEYTLEAGVVVLGDFGFVGRFVSLKTRSKCCYKVIGKKLITDAKLAPSLSEVI